MPGAERIKRAFAAFGKAGQPGRLTQGADAVAPPGQDLVRVTLVTHVPDQPVARRVENRMQRDGQLDDPQPRAQVPASFRHGGNRFGPYLVGQLFQLGIRQRLHVGGNRYAVQDRGGGSVGHASSKGYLSREITNSAASRKVSAA